MSDNEPTPGHLTEVCLTVPEGKSDILLADLLTMFPRGLQERPGSLPGTVVYILHFSGKVCLPDLPGVEVTRRKIPKLNWAQEARKHFEPLEIGPLRIIAPWMDARDSEDVVIEPGMAFGTGGHESTRLALRCLLDVMAQSTPTSLLDVGCGTGILAISALRLGVSEGIACDIDQSAVEATLRNTEANDFLSRLRVERADIAEADFGSFPLVLANLNAPIITSRAKALADSTSAGGDLVLSGIYREQVERVVEALSDGFDEVTRIAEGYWFGLRLRRREEVVGD